MNSDAALKDVVHNIGQISVGETVQNNKINQYGLMESMYHCSILWNSLFKLEWIVYNNTSFTYFMIYL